jgi:hypothetical protein
MDHLDGGHESLHKREVEPHPLFLGKIVLRSVATPTVQQEIKGVPRKGNDRDGPTAVDHIVAALPHARASVRCRSVDGLFRDFRQQAVGPWWVEQRCIRAPSRIPERSHSPVSTILIRYLSTAHNRDIAAVRAAIATPWSNGQTEGQITRLKLIKRQMYPAKPPFTGAARRNDDATLAYRALPSWTPRGGAALRGFAPGRKLALRRFRAKRRVPQA